MSHTTIINPKRKRRVQVKVELVKFYRSNPQASTIEAVQRFNVTRRTAQKYRRLVVQQAKYLERID